MNTIHNNGENDKTLNDDLEKLGRAYEQLSNEEPPQLLDQAILNSAHRAVEKKPHWMKFGWLHGLTTAAIAVIALSVVINQREQVPGFDDVIKVDEPAALMREKAGKKSHAEKQVEELRMEIKEEDAGRQDAAPIAPVPAARVNEAMEAAIGEQNAEAESRARRPVYAQDSLPAKSDSTGSDADIREMIVDESMMDDVDLAGDDPGSGIISKQLQPAAVAAMPATGFETSAETDADIEKRLLSIIKLKQSGDQAWITELNRFKQTYPDYPLPKELSD